MSIEEMRRFMGAASLAFLSVDGLYRAMGCDRRDAVCPQFSDHCFTGEYPTDLTDSMADSGERPLTHLTEAS
jgi:amidophosphoribosyltransferase